ncbi:sal-like protein 3 isoform X2 [Watersipora subatra]|uniref:sal-like protein 3 isoform X2 n=1 Tax=Watersipora subatra TaxID=2589382 RepID=UPI00355B314C
MPRRKQDKPQHLEEDMKLEQLSSGAVRDCVENMRIGKQLEKEDKREFSDFLLAKEDGCNGVGESSEETRPSSGVDDEAPAAISSRDWLNVQSNLDSIQQQLLLLQHQQYQLMQLLASQNQDSNSPVSTDCGSSNSVKADCVDSQCQRGQTVKSASCQVSVINEQAEKSETELKADDIAAEDEEKKTASSPNVEIDGSFDADLGTLDNDDEEPASFDCTRCSAVLPSPELLGLHMFSHEKREVTSERISSTDKDAGASAPGSSSFGSLPPSYQSVINDLSNDSLEEYMEIQKPENTHLEHLVKNMDGTVTDPNQCLICKRILSCKSALMMHYRTHTGERPFKCKLCSRAFTTKGNLKTHMGVHRAKPPLKLLHTCIVCNKQFTNALVLNQHMKIHSEEPSRKRTLDVQSSIGSEENKRQRLTITADSGYKDEPADISFDLVKKALPLPDFHPLTSLAPTSAPGFPYEFGGMPSIPDPLRYAELLARQWEQFSQYSVFNPMTPVKTPIFSSSLAMPGPPGLGPFSLGTGFLSNTGSKGKGNFLNSEEFVQPTDKPKQQDADLEDKLSETSQNDRSTSEPIMLSNNSPKSEQSWGSCETSSGANGANGANGTVKFDPPPGTTCDICLKTFACRSALEIHYRSHTKHRPFKCNMCDKAFTTRGNMKQHVLTHKTDDMPWSGGGDKPVVPQAATSPNSDASHNNEDLKRSGGRHQCSVCLKYFSSASAVQIHFRTHTGVRPFKCGMCGKAFTTKGNLKVHMGTHMWNGSAATGSNRLEVNEGSEAKNDDEIIRVTSPNRGSLMNNNNLGWNPFNQNPLTKPPFPGGPSRLLGSYPSMFLASASLQNQTNEELAKPWAWQPTCHICNKELPSAAALELHMKLHLVNETATCKPVPAT